MIINTNIQAMNAQRNLGITGGRMGKALERLSSGLRINRAADDAAGLSISEGMRAQIRGLQQGNRNAQDAISMVQTAEGALNEVHGILQRMRELTVQAGNSTLSTTDRNAIQDELGTLRTEVDNIAARTKFNGLSLLTGSLATTYDPTSTAGGATVGGGVIGLAVADIDVSKAAAGSTFTLTGDGAGGLTLDNGTGITQKLTVAAMNTANGTQTLDYSALGVKLTLRHDASATAVTAATITTAAAGAGTSFTNLTVKTLAASSSATYQVGANATDTISVAFGDMRGAALGVSAGTVNTIANANTYLSAIDAAITTVSAQRSKLGAAQNQVEFAVNSLGVAVENITASESRIRDADIAQVSTELVTRQIMQQAGVSVLSQANTSAQAALNLLK